MSSDNDFINTIAPDVLTALERKKFFEVLDDGMCPKDPRAARELCQGTFAISTAALISCDFDQEEIVDVLAVLAAKGRCCDCEVLYNVAQESRLRSEYWKAVSANRKPLHGHGMAGALQKEATSWVLVWIFIPKDEVGYPESQDWEDLWARPTRHGRLVIGSVPFFAKGIARSDEVAVVVSQEGFLAVDKITERGGHSTFRIWLLEDFISSMDEVVRDLEAMGAAVELTLQRLLTIDGDGGNESKVWDYLQQGVRSSRWEVQVGHSPG